MTTQVHIDVVAIEEAFVAHWTNYGQAPGGVFHDDGDLVWTEAPVSQLPYNVVLRTRLGSNAEERIDQVTRHFRERRVQFLWLVHPTAKPHNLAERLTAQGLSLVEHATGMALDLRSWSSCRSASQGPITYREVKDEPDMRAFEELIADYWELPEQSYPYVFAMNRWVFESGDRGVRWVAYRDGQPVGKAYLSYRGVEDTAAIFAVYVRPAARGHGVARTLSELAIERAAETGRRRVVLHERCTLHVYATSALHGMPPAQGQ
ncbi:MAG: GNAT family N-acetyltransferase [Panacagrimonas sp.]